MNTNKLKATVESLDIMIQNSDKGPSGFWVEDHEGCGNPLVFPEFDEGLKQGRLVQKEHYLCPWNTAVMYGAGHGNITTGCYHSCSIEKAKYLSSSMVRNVLQRFKVKLLNGEYDSTVNLEPLLTEEEANYIEKQIVEARSAEEKRNRELKEERRQKAATLIRKYPEYADLFAIYYGEKTIVQTYDGNIDFAPDGFSDIVGAEKFTYDDYIDVQIRSFKKVRGWFATCYYNIPLSFKGSIEKKTKDNVCFNRIMVEGMYPDGICFEGKEEHVWMSNVGFEGYEIGDCVSFFAEVYRYVKTGSGKQIDFSLRDPQSIKKIDVYSLPTDEELEAQAINEIICETCYLSDHCNRTNCVLAKPRKRRKKKQPFKNLEEAGNGPKKQGGEQ